MKMFYEYVPEWGWLCRVSSGAGAPFLVRRPDERRYKEILDRKAEAEMVQVAAYTCRHGAVYTLLKDTDDIGARRVINGANANYSKYKKLLGEDTSFADWEPAPVLSYQGYQELFLKIFHLFFVADGAVLDV